ncbi:UNVERIFIED_CONTAM: hypothetical protein Sindi_2025300 [Sesamum indicum]
MEGSLRRNNREEETPRRGGSMLHLTRDELQRMIEEGSKNAIVEYERRTTTPVEKGTVRRKLFENRELMGESEEPSKPKRRSRRPAMSEAGSSSQVESVGKHIESLHKQIDELKKQGEIVSNSKNSPFNNDILIQVVEPGFRVPDLQRYDGAKDPYEHVAAFEMVMNLRWLSGPIMAKLFATTLAEKAQEWFISLPQVSRGAFNKAQRVASSPLTTSANLRTHLRSALTQHAERN